MPGGHRLVYWSLDLFLCGHRFHVRAGGVGSMYTIAAWSWLLRTIRMVILEYFMPWNVSSFVDKLLRTMKCYHPLNDR